MVLPSLLPPPIVSFEFVIIPAIYFYSVHLLVLAIFGTIFWVSTRKVSIFMPFRRASKFVAFSSIS